MAGSLFRKALSAFVEIEDSPKPTVQQVQSASMSAPTGLATATVPIMTSAVVSLSQEDLARYAKHFDEILDKANLPGPDYYEFF